MDADGPEISDDEDRVWIAEYAVELSKIERAAEKLPGLSARERRDLVRRTRSRLTRRFVDGLVEQPSPLVGLALQGVR